MPPPPPPPKKKVYDDLSLSLQLSLIFYHTTLVDWHNFKSKSWICRFNLKMLMLTHATFEQKTKQNNNKNNP